MINKQNIRTHYIVMKKGKVHGVVLDYNTHFNLEMLDMERTHLKGGENCMII